LTAHSLSERGGAVIASYQNEGAVARSRRVTPYQNEGVPSRLLIRTRGLRRGTPTAHSLSERGGAVVDPYQNEGAATRSSRCTPYQNEGVPSLLFIRTREQRRGTKRGLEGSWMKWGARHALPPSSLASSLLSSSCHFRGRCGLARRGDFSGVPLRAVAKVSFRTRGGLGAVAWVALRRGALPVVGRTGIR
jgi:hypothetical protein